MMRNCARLNLAVVGFVVLSVLGLQAGVAGASGAPKLKTLNMMISTLLYGESQAGGVSYAAQRAYDFAHDYPGSYNKAKFFAAAKKNAAKYCAATDVPDLATIMPDTGWRGPAAYPSDYGSYLFAGKKPKGFTYILTINSSCSDGSHSSPSQVHVTILKNKAYFYFAP